MTKGWHGHSPEHSLAARGIKLKSKATAVSPFKHDPDDVVSELMQETHFDTLFDSASSNKVNNLEEVETLRNGILSVHDDIQNIFEGWEILTTSDELRQNGFIKLAGPTVMIPYKSRGPHKAARGSSSGSSVVTSLYGDNIQTYRNKGDVVDFSKNEFVPARPVLTIVITPITFFGNDKSEKDLSGLSNLKGEDFKLNMEDDKDKSLMRNITKKYSVSKRTKAGKEFEEPGGTNFAFRYDVFFSFHALPSLPNETVKGYQNPINLKKAELPVLDKANQYTTYRKKDGGKFDLENTGFAYNTVDFGVKIQKFKSVYDGLALDNSSAVMNFDKLRPALDDIDNL